MKRKHYIYLLIFLLILLIIIFRDKIENAGINYLSLTKKVEANALLIEGWLPDYAIDTLMKKQDLNDYKYILTTGVQLPDHFVMFVRGFLIFNFTRDQAANSEGHLRRSIDVIAAGSTEKELGAKFELWINDSLTETFTTSLSFERYSFHWPASEGSIDSLLIHFNNDGFVNGRDRNLYIKEIRIDSISYSPYSENVFSDLKELDNTDRSENTYHSYAEMAAKNLISKGIHPEKVIGIPAGSEEKFRTLESARAFRNWLRNNDLDIQGLNIVSLGSHSRRTWKTYKKLLKPMDIRVGIISIPPYYTMSSQFNKRSFNLMQLAAFLYYSVYLLFVR